ncbi:MAG: RNA polymerase sigma-G factor, partial [Bacilli bacterium]|nr:RNA polymerase sigma-G factor [Bacilli bacterium]
MANYKVEITGVNTSELTVLSQEEQTLLFQAYQNGDIKAKEKLIEGNLKLVLSVLRGYQNRNVNMDDLFQVGV